MSLKPPTLAQSRRILTLQSHNLESTTRSIRTPSSSTPIVLQNRSMLQKKAIQPQPKIDQPKGKTALESRAVVRLEHRNRSCRSQISMVPREIDDYCTTHKAQCSAAQHNTIPCESATISFKEEVKSESRIGSLSSSFFPLELDVKAAEYIHSKP